MKSPSLIFKSRTAVRLLAVILIGVLLLPGGAVWAGLQPPLSKIPVPVPRTNEELAQPQFVELQKYIQNVPAAIRLGKALFWDMQVGSDGQVACATCHYMAGADPTGPAQSNGIRSRNQINPGPGGFATNALGASLGPDYTLSGGDFPFFQIAPVDGRVGVDTIPDLFGAITATITRDVNDIVGSQGVHRTIFTGLSGTAIDSGTPDPAAPFNNSRQVTGRNAPSVINAVFNHANFWDGRANNIFNGVTPFGPLDQNARIWRNNNGLQLELVRIPNASLASQAVGPPNNSVEMAFAGRTFPELGRKMLGLTPLGQQRVDPNDSVLGGALSNSPGTGLRTNYTQMIQEAFVDTLWNAGGQNITIDTRGAPVQFSQIEANFSLFWGLSIMLYEATLVSDRTPFDRFQLGNMNALSLGAQLGLATFDSKCAVCHSGAELSDAVIGSNAVPNCIAPDCNLVSFTSNTNHKLIQLNQTSTLGAKSDTGFFNVSVRPTADDPGRGGLAFDFPLSFSRLADFPGLPFETPVNPPFAPVTDAVQGSFKTPGLRNVELNPPYFHNGSALSLLEVVEFYARGGNFPFNPGNPTGNPQHATAALPMGKIRGGGTERGELVLFLQSLNDERVRLEKAPFDHPELIIPDGGGASITRAATGGFIPPVQVNLLTLNPVASPTTAPLPVIGGFVDQTATVAVNVPGRAPAVATVLNNAWNFTFPSGFPLGESVFDIIATSPTGETRTLPANSIVLLPTALILGGPLGATKQTSATMAVSGIDAGGRPVHFYKFKLDNGAYSADVPVDTPIALNNIPDGGHTVSVLVRDSLGNQQLEASPTTVTWTIKSIPPVVTIEAIPLPTRETSLTITGTISDLGIIPKVTTDSGATAVCSGTTAWSCQISGLKKGTNNITVTATDIAQNVGSATTGVIVILPDGSFKGTAAPDIGDAIKALRIAVGTIPQPSLEDMMHGDVAPLDSSGVPAPDGTIDATDALLILKKVVGLVNF